MAVAIDPYAPQPGIWADTPVEAAWGPAAARELIVGKAIGTEGGAVARVAAIDYRVAMPENGVPDLAIQPVRIAAGALGPNLPQIDLRLLGGTPIRVDGAVLLAQQLIDGVRITRERLTEPAHYVGHSLDPPGPVFAAGLALCPMAPAVDWISLARLRDQLTAPFGRPEAELHGNIDGVDRNGIAGWVIDPQRPDCPVLLELHIDGALAAMALADRFRDDLERAKLARGWCAFNIAMPVTLPADRPHIIMLRRHAGAHGIGPGGGHVPGSPLLLDRTPTLETALIAFRKLAEASTAESRYQIAQQVEQLLQLRAQWLFDGRSENPA